MKQKINADSTFLKIFLCSLIIFCVAALPAFSQEKELAHPFFTHMGMPDPVGNYSLRVPLTATEVDGKTQADFAFHFETGLSKTIGLHIRNDRFLNDTHSEIMFQFVAIKSKNGMSGFCPIIEFEVPTHKGVKRINTLVGFTTAFVRPSFSFNQVLHYGPAEDNLEGSAAVVYRISNGVFFVVEILGEKVPSESAALNMLGGVKVSVGKYLTLGIGYRLPVTDNRSFSSQYVFSPDVEW